MKKKVRVTICIVLAILCLIYGVIVRAVGSGTSFFIVWWAMGMMFGAFALVAKKSLWKKMPLVVRRILSVVIVAAVVCVVIVEGLIITAFMKHGEPNLDYIIVLGAQVHESGPSIVLKYRLDKAVEYLEENPDTKCIVSGGQGANEPFAEAEGMATYLEKKGIAKERILLEKESTTTEQNIKYSKKLIAESNAKIGLVTNNFHLYRALQIARGEDLGDISGIAAGSTKLFLPNNMLREILGEMKYLITHIG